MNYTFIKANQIKIANGGSFDGPSLQVKFLNKNDIKLLMQDFKDMREQTKRHPDILILTYSLYRVHTKTAYAAFGSKCPTNNYNTGHDIHTLLTIVCREDSYRLALNYLIHLNFKS